MYFLHILAFGLHKPPALGFLHFWALGVCSTEGLDLCTIFYCVSWLQPESINLAVSGGGWEEGCAWGKFSKSKLDLKIIIIVGLTERLLSVSFSQVLSFIKDSWPISREVRNAVSPTPQGLRGKERISGNNFEDRIEYSSPVRNYIYVETCFFAQRWPSLKTQWNHLAWSSSPASPQTSRTQEFELWELTPVSLATHQNTGHFVSWRPSVLHLSSYGALTTPILITQLWGTFTRTEEVDSFLTGT